MEAKPEATGEAADNEGSKTTSGVEADRDVRINESHNLEIGNQGEENVRLIGADF